MLLKKNKEKNQHLYSSILPSQISNKNYKDKKRQIKLRDV